MVQAKKLIWEVFVDEARVSQYSAMYPERCDVETYSIQNGWDFRNKATREEFLRKVDAQMPDEVLLAPPCQDFTQMQNLAISRFSTGHEKEFKKPG